MRLVVPLFAATVLAGCGPKPPAIGDAGANGNSLGQDIPLSIVTTSLSSGVAGQPYLERVSARGGTQPYQWAVDAGGPAWLSISSSGILTGTPVSPETDAVPLLLFDSNDGGVSKVLALTIGSCAEGATRTCYLPNALACVQGAQTCSGGAWGTCSGGSPSSTIEACGASCSSCGASANTCDGGVCACNPGGPCAGSAPSCCITGCSDLTSDPNNCGACDRACDPTPRINVTRTCDAGACSFPCSSSYQHCNSNPLAGCESNQLTDLNNCGGCNQPCHSPSGGGTVSCIGGSCSQSCPGGNNLCTSGYNDAGAYCSPPTDVNNCAGCGRVCAAGPHAVAATCTGTNCVMTCDAGFADCDNDGGLAGWQNGCETPTSADVNNCGGCGIRCSGNWPACINGRCCESTTCNNGIHCCGSLTCDTSITPPRCG